MTNRETINILQANVVYACEKAGLSKATVKIVEDALDMAIAALEKLEQSCDTCRHGRFGDRQCDNCGVRYPNHYEAEEEA